MERGSVLVAPRPHSLFELRPGSDVDVSRLTDPTNESPSSAHQPVSDVGPDELKSAHRLKKGGCRRAAMRRSAADFIKQLLVGVGVATKGFDLLFSLLQFRRRFWVLSVSTLTPRSWNSTAFHLREGLDVENWRWLQSERVVITTHSHTPSHTQPDTHIHANTCARTL